MLHAQKYEQENYEGNIVCVYIVMRRLILCTIKYEIYLSLYVPQLILRNILPDKIFAFSYIYTKYIKYCTLTIK